MSNIKRYVLSVCVGEDGDIEPELSERKDGFIVLYADHQSALAEALKPKVCRWTKTVNEWYPYTTGCEGVRRALLTNYCSNCGGKVEVE